MVFCGAVPLGYIPRLLDRVMERRLAVGRDCASSYDGPRRFWKASRAGQASQIWREMAAKRSECAAITVEVAIANRKAVAGEDGENIRRVVRTPSGT
jgi:hypothetical protein